MITVSKSFIMFLALEISWLESAPGSVGTTQTYSQPNLFMIKENGKRRRRKANIVRESIS